MRRFFVALLAGGVCVALPAAARAPQADDAKLRGLVQFVLDVEIYRGGFYAVYDYCAAHVPPLIAQQTMDAWMGDNQRYLTAQQQAERQFLAAMAGRDAEQSSRERLAAAKRKYFSGMRVNNRLISEIEPLQDKETACAKRMGEMVSHSFALQQVMPETYRYWAQQFGSRAH